MFFWDFRGRWWLAMMLRANLETKLRIINAKLEVPFRRAGLLDYRDSMVSHKKVGITCWPRARASVKNTPVVQQVRQKFHFHMIASRVWVNLPARISGFTTYDIRGCLFYRGIRTYSSWQFVRCHRRAAAAPFHAILKTNRSFVCIPQIRHICRSEYLFRRAAFGRF